MHTLSHKVFPSFRHKMFSGSRLSDRCIGLFFPSVVPIVVCSCRCGSVTGGRDGGSRWALSSYRPDSPCQRHWHPSRECIPVTRHHRQPLRHPTSAWQRQDRRLQQQPSLPKVRIPLTVVWVSDDDDDSCFLLPERKKESGG